jgi:hypothetical protein
MNIVKLGAKAQMVRIHADLDVAGVTYDKSIGWSDEHTVSPDMSTDKLSFEPELSVTSDYCTSPDPMSGPFPFCLAEEPD